MTTGLCAEDVIVRLSSPQINTERLVICGDEEEIDDSSNDIVGQTRIQNQGGVELGRQLLLASRAGDTATVLDLMAKGAPFTTDWLGTSPLHLAAANGHVETCGVLLRAGVSRDARTKVERTPLHLAAHAGHDSTAELLLQWGASPHARDLLCMTPLHWAAARGHAAAARALLRAGADPRARCKFLKTPRCHASRAGHRSLLVLLDAAEADASAAALAEQMADEKPKIKPKLEIVQRIQEIKQSAKVKTPQKIEVDRTPQFTDGGDVVELSGVRVAAGAAGGREASAAALLRQHGITLLPNDDGSTVLNALQSGRTIVLSDAGKLMLKESSGTEPGSGVNCAASAGGGAARSKGVVVRATPVRSPPRGVKVFALQNKLVMNSGQSTPQMKYVQMLGDAKTTQMKVPMKAKTKQGSRPAVKIVMNKANFNKLLANANKPTLVPVVNEQISTVSNTATMPIITTATKREMDPECVGAEVEECKPGCSERQLRAQLQAAQAALADLSAELRVCRARLAQYEGSEQ